MRFLSVLLILLILIPTGGCKKKARITSVKVEPAPPEKPKPKPKPRGKRYPEQIKNRDPKTLLGGERGLDHVGVAVKDIEGAQQAYQKLGFGNPQPGQLPDGLRNVAFPFGDTTHLELITVSDAKKNPGVASFVDKHVQGALSLMLCAFSYGETANLLRRRGFKVGETRPGRIETKGGHDGFNRGKKPPMWHTFSVDGAALPGNISFIVYNRGLRNFVLFKVKNSKILKKHFSHPNTALGLKSAWIAVKSLAQAKKAFEKVGLAAGRALTLTPLEARAQVIQAGEGTLLLLQPSARGKGPVAAFLKRRDEGIIGMSFQVEQLDKARSVVEENLTLKLEPYDGAQGRSVLVPADKAAGVWVELFQARRGP